MTTTKSKLTWPFLDAGVRSLGLPRKAAWEYKAEAAVLTVAKRQRYFTTDDVWKHVEKPDEPRWLGHIMRSLKRRGYIKPTQITRKSNQPDNHGRPVRVWESKHARWW